MSSAPDERPPRPLALDVELDPDVTSDEREEGESTPERQRLRRMLEDVPPHHGD